MYIITYTKGRTRYILRGKGRKFAMFRTRSSALQAAKKLKVKNPRIARLKW